MEQKYFTLDEANQLLPFLQTELTTLQQIQKDFYKLYQLLQTSRRKADASPNTKEWEDEVFTLECQLEFMQMEFDMHLKTITSRGIQVKDVDLGLIDFPAIYKGEEVLLCWLMGEPEVSYYHSHDEGFVGRKKIS